MSVTLTTANQIVMTTAIIITIITSVLLQSLSGSVAGSSIHARSGTPRCHVDHTTPGPRYDVDCL